MASVAVFPSAWSAHRLDFRDYQLSAIADHHELHLVTGFQIRQHAFVLGGENHRHARHIQVLDISVLMVTLPLS